MICRALQRAGVDGQHSPAHSLSASASASGGKPGVSSSLLLAGSAAQRKLTPCPRLGACTASAGLVDGAGADRAQNQHGVADPRGRRVRMFCRPGRAGLICMSMRERPDALQHCSWCVARGGKDAEMKTLNHRLPVKQCSHSCLSSAHSAHSSRAVHSLCSASWRRIAPPAGCAGAWWRRESARIQECETFPPGARCELSEGLDQTLIFTVHPVPSRFTLLCAKPRSIGRCNRP